MKKVRDAIVTTVYNRSELVLMNTFAGVLKQDLADTHLIVVDDNSDKEYKTAKDLTRSHATWLRVDTLKDRPGTYNINGYNNPAYAFNRGAELAQDMGAERLFLLSSDCIIQPNALKTLRQLVTQNAIACTRTVDMDSGTTYCSTARIWPLPWFIGCKLKHASEIGGWDETFLHGIACEDNDFVGRLFFRVQKLAMLDVPMTWHQSHPDTAYSDGQSGWEINKQYIRSRWGQIPFERNGAPFKFTVRPTQPGVTFALSPEPTTPMPWLFGKQEVRDAAPTSE
jgi:glycosyltransferase involved in cell wall biosynthesis